MSFDFHAYYPAVTIAGLENLLKAPPGKRASTLVRLLAQTAASEETKLTGVAGHQRVVRSPAYRKELEEGFEVMKGLDLGAPDSLEWRGLPRLCCYLRLDFRLGSPYLGRDDRAFSVTENPVRKETVFGAPFISGTTWKGALRHASRFVKPSRTERLFGPARKEEEETKAEKGLVLCYPSFFDKVDFEIINPHERGRRTGKKPIRLECVPKGAESRFAVLYVPRWPQAAGDEGERETKAKGDQASFVRDVGDDLGALIGSVHRLLRDHGISAKRSSGYGEVLPQLVGRQGIVAVNHAEVAPIGFENLSGLAAVREEVVRGVERLS